MQRGNLTREQAVAIVGEAAVAAAEAKNCEPTNRIGMCGSCRGDELTEWSAGVSCEDNNGGGVVVSVYYYTTNAQDEQMAEDGDGARIDWEISGYEIA